MDRVRPAVIVCLGRTAAQAVLGAHVSAGELRGRLVPTSRAKGCVVTWHTYPMPHSVSIEEIQHIRAWLISVLH